MPLSSRRLRLPLPLAGAVLLYAAVRLASLERWDIWYDEAFSLAVAGSDWSGLFQAALQDQVNPPLFYILLKGWLLVAPASPTLLRLLPCSFAVLAALPVLAWLDEAEATVEEQAGVLLLAAFSPILVLQSVELRTYGLFLLLASVSQLYTLRLARPGAGAAREAREWAALAVTNVLMVYAHYYGWLTVGAEALVLWFLRPDRRRWLALGVVAVGVAFLPWAAAVAAAAREHHAVAPNLSWIRRPGPAAVLELSVGLLGGRGVAGTLFVFVAAVIPALWMGTRALRRPSAQPALAALAALAFGPPLMSLIASWILPRPVWAPRFMVAAAFPFLALAVFGIRRSGAWGPRLLAPVTLGLVLLTGWAFSRAGSDKIPWRMLVNRMAPAGESSDSVRVYTFEGFTALPIAYYRSLDAKRLDLRRVASLLDAGPGWIVARDSAWPGHREHGTLPDAVRALGLEVFDSLHAEAPSQIIRGYRVGAKSAAAR